MPVGAVVGASVVGAGSSIIAGNKASKAQRNAANTAAAAQDRSSETQLEIFNQQREDFAPWRDVGQSALYKLADMYGVSRPTGAAPAPARPPLPGVAGALGFNGGAPGTQRMFPMPSTRVPAQPATPMTKGYDGWQQSPGYQFRVGEATKAIERSAAARGGLRSGATMDALQRRVQGVASEEYDNYANRLAALAGVGQSAAAGQAAAGANYGQSVAQGAAAQGNIAMAAGNARASGYANIGNAINSGVQNLAGAYLYNQGWGGKG